MTRIGYIGLGNMGGPLARRVLGEHKLAVFDMNPAAVQAFVEAGAVGCSSPRDLATRCDVLVLCLPTSNHVRDVLFGSEGIADSLAPGALVIDQTTGDPTATRVIAGELAQHSINFIDAPVSGSVARAEAGTIAIMVGASQQLFERALPVLSAISPQIFHVGNVGAGHTMKLVNNLVSFTQRLVTQEAVVLGAKNGIDPSVAADVLLVSSGRNTYVENDLKTAVLSGDLATNFSLGLTHKDVRLACQLGVDSGVPMFFGNIARDVYQMAITEHGAGASMDYANLLMDRIAGTSVVPVRDQTDN